MVASSGPKPPRRRWTLGMVLAVVAMIAANVALVAQINRDTGNWQVGLMMLGANVLFCAPIAPIVRFRPFSLLAMFTTAALTETMLWQMATARQNTDWIVAVAVLGGGFVFLVLASRHFAAARR